MPEVSIPVDWPMKGLSENYGFGEQEQGTAREMRNVRNLDPRTGRLRGAQRSGLSKYNTNVLKTAGTKVQDLLSFFEDNRLVTYSAIASGSETITWASATPSKSDCLNLKTDRQGNVYALDGDAALVKYSASGTKLWQLSLPVKDQSHLIRALAVDDVDRIFIGVSSGGKQEDALLWCYEQLNDNKVEKLWEISPGSYIEDMKVFQDRLYTVQNETDRRRSWIRIYDLIGTANPVLDKEIKHNGYPAHSLAVKADGAIVVGSGISDSDDTTDYWRDSDPKFPNFGPTSEDWTPYNLDSFKRRIWSWYVADDIDESDVAGDLEEGVQVLRWRDRSGNNRHFRDAQSLGYRLPRLALDSISGHKGVRWDTVNSSTNRENNRVLRTNSNSTYDKEYADQQETALPMYTGSQWCMFMVLRPSQQDITAGDKIRAVFGQDRDNANSGAKDHVIAVNRTTGDTLASSVSAGNITHYFGSGGEAAGDPGAGNNGEPEEESFLVDANNSNSTRAVILTVLYDGGLDPGDSSSSATRSLFQANGNPGDRYEGVAQFSTYHSYIGNFEAPTGGLFTSVGQYSGDVLEIIVLDRKDRNDDTAGILTHDGLEYSSLGADSETTQTNNEMTRFVGYLAHKYGLQRQLPYAPVVASSGRFPHPYGRTVPTNGSGKEAGPPKADGSGVNTAIAKLNRRWAAVTKYAPEGATVWTVNQQDFGDDSSYSGGFGWAVAVNSEGNIYSLGPKAVDDTPADSYAVRMIVDQGTTYSIASADGAWEAAFPSNAFPDYAYPRIDVDEFDNLYIPYNDSAAAASLRVYSKTGTVLHSKLLSSSQQSYAVAVDRRIPEYRNDLSTKRVEHVFVGTENGGDTSVSTVHKVKLVSSAQSGASPRSLVTLGVSGGDIKKFTTSAVTTPTGGSGALDSSAYVQSTSLYKKAYWTDGRQVKTYDPITGTVSTLECESAGAVPDRCSLIESWRGRLVLARSADEPHNWYLSKKDDPTNWDYFPPTPSEVDAVAGNNSSAGLCPDIINAVVPYSEDVLVFGGDHSIWMLVGDPAAGGRFELVSDVTGMSFGRPWCKDPTGVLYFFGSQGGIYSWVPGSRPERLSLNRIERTLQDIDLSTSYMSLVYNYKDEGIHILQMPFGSGGTLLTHWFLELKTESFVEDVFGSSASTNVQPTAAIIVDGDDFDDRMVLFGCEDGYVRKWDRTAYNDDTRTNGTTPNAIDALVTIGPLQGADGSEGMETQFSGLAVVLGDQDFGARYELYAAESPESIGAARCSGTLEAGRNPPKWDRVTGPYCWLRLRNSAAGQRFSFERALIKASMAGLARPKNR